MDFNEFLKSAIQYVVVAVPQMLIILYTVLYYLKKIKNKTEDFPNQVQQTKDTVKTSLDASKESATKAYQAAKSEMVGIVTNFTKELKKEVQGEMEKMSQELKTYRDTLSSTSDFVQILTKENQAFLDIMITLIAKDPDKIREGISSSISKRIQEAEYDLRDYKKEVLETTVSLESAMRKMLEEMSKKEFDDMLVRVGYGREKL